MTHKNHLVIIVSLMTALFATSTLAQEGSPVVVIAPGEPIILGVSLGLSGGTAGSALGVDALRGITLALEDAPALQFGEQSFPLQFDPQDSACSAEGAAANAEYFTEDPRVVGILGPHCSDA